jgi:hypothetical protein
MLQKINRLIYPSMILLLLAACGGGSSGSGGQDVTSLSQLAGVWDYSEGGNDVWYIYFDQNGNVSDYDYQGDTVDNGADCYDADVNWDTITHISGNTFRSTSSGIEFTAVIDSNGALVTKDPGGKTIFPATNVTLADINAKLCGAPRTQPKLLFRAK